MSLPVLIVLHQEHSSPGRIGLELKRRGIPLDIRRPRFDDPLPRTLRDHAGAVIFGGPQSANDKDKFIRREIDWISVPLKEKKPLSPTMIWSISFTFINVQASFSRQVKVLSSVEGETSPEG